LLSKPFYNKAKIAYGPETGCVTRLLPPSYLHCYKHRRTVSTPVNMVAIGRRKRLRPI